MHAYMIKATLTSTANLKDNSNEHTVQKIKSGKLICIKI